MFDSTISIIKPGFFTTIQDQGRNWGTQDGFPKSGAIDQYSYHLANVLLSNDANDAELEFAIKGFTAVFSAPTFIALTGAHVKATLNDKPVPRNRALRVHANDVLTLGQTTNGNYGYLAIRHGIQTIPVLKSRSTTASIHIGGIKGRKLRSGDQIPYWQANQLDAVKSRRVINHRDSHQRPLIIDTLPGPQFKAFDPQSRKRFFGQVYHMTPNMNRMGYRLKGQALDSPHGNLLSEATAAGGIQITRSGQPIVLMTDRQTTGGYPVIGVVTTEALPKLVQCRLNVPIKFRLTRLSSAQREHRQAAQIFNVLKQKFYAAKY